MFIFVPPSEGKAAPTDAQPVITGSLVLPQLAPVRASLLEALERLSSGPEDHALATLGLTVGQRHELTHNQTVATSPAAPAADVYRGVLYEALDLPGLREDHPAAYKRAQESVLVFSGLWGVVRPDDRIPYYRCSAGVKLPGHGSVTAVWKQALADPLAGLVGEELVVDLRSTSYAGMWKPTAAGGGKERTVTLRVLHERMVGGELRRTVVSHFNKATKGRLVRAVLMAGADPTTPEEFAEALRDLGFRVEGGDGANGAFDVVVEEI
jgi:cytoplasmic iron level regulating protein YaaA (DUF328/UPF0246 family)